MDKVAKVIPDFPNENPTVSYWQDPPADIANLRSTEQLPPESEFVVVGSGISGAFIAYNILEKCPDAKIVLLEARQACSGATGRNGGHTKPANYRSWLSDVKALGMEEASRIVTLQRANVVATHQFAREHDIDCDSCPCDTVDIIYDPAQWSAGVAAIESIRKNVPKAEVYTIIEQDEARKIYLTPDALGAFKYSAGSISAYKFVIGVLKLALAKGLNLQTNTMVTGVQKSGVGWQVETSRGTIVTPNAIFATNGYTARLLPDFQGVIVPLRGQITAQRPGSGLPKEGLNTTYSFIYKDGYEYMIPRPQGTKWAGDIVIGGGWAQLPDQGTSLFGVTDDSIMDKDVGLALRACTPRYFGQNWGSDHPDGHVRTEWTGIMGNSADGHPFVGEVPGRKGLWLSASFDGHGMASCLKCAEGLVTMIVGDEHAQRELDKWFPRSYRTNAQRLHQAFEGRRNLKPTMSDYQGAHAQL